MTRNPDPLGQIVTATAPVLAKADRAPTKTPPACISPEQAHIYTIVVDGPAALERFAPDVKDEPRPVWSEALLARVVIAQELPARRFPRRVTKW